MKEIIIYLEILLIRYKKKYIYNAPYEYKNFVIYKICEENLILRFIL